MGFTYYYSECHKCGQLTRYTDPNEMGRICRYCGGNLVDSGKVLTEEERIAEEKTWRKAREEEIYNEYIKGNEEREKEYAYRLEVQQRELARMISQVQQQYANRPHCPRCGSVNLRDETSPISTGESYIFIDTIVCNNCGYHWDV